jgi:hypothetical protein
MVVPKSLKLSAQKRNQEQQPAASTGVQSVLTDAILATNVSTGRMPPRGEQQAAS